MKIVFYHPDGTTATYQVGVGGVTHIDVDAQGLWVKIKYDLAPDTDFTVGLMPYVLTKS